MCIRTPNTGQLNPLFYTFAEFRRIVNRVVARQSTDWLAANAQFSPDDLRQFQDKIASFDRFKTLLANQDLNVNYLSCQNMLCMPGNLLTYHRYFPKFVAKITFDILKF